MGMIAEHGSRNNSSKAGGSPKTLKRRCLTLFLSITLISSFAWVIINIRSAACLAAMAPEAAQRSQEKPVDRDAKRSEAGGGGGGDGVPVHCQQPYWPALAETEFHLLDCARRVALLRRPVSNTASASLGGKGGGGGGSGGRVALMFHSRGGLPHEPLWRRFLHGHEDSYSLYCHTHPDFSFPNTSLFHGHQVPSKVVKRLSMSLAEAIRRLIAYALLDPEHGAENEWFVNLCEASIPIRSFRFMHEYLTRSSVSFVESFAPVPAYLKWETEPQFRREQMRKGEVWMALARRHALVVLDDWTLYFKFKTGCARTRLCGPDEQYIQTLLAIRDAGGLANRTLTYVNWAHEHAGSPHTYFGGADMPVEWFRDVQGRVVDTDGMYHDTSLAARETNVTFKPCIYNGKPNHPCFIFARKVSWGATAYLESLPAAVLGY